MASAISLRRYAASFDDVKRYTLGFVDMNRALSLWRCAGFPASGSAHAGKLVDARSREVDDTVQHSEYGVYL